MSFEQFACAHGILVKDLYPSERIQRGGTVDKPRSKNGAWFWDGKRGWVMAWDGDGRVHWYDDPKAIPWTPEEKAAWQAKRLKHNDERDHLARAAAAKATKLLALAKPGTHGYLMRKGFKDAQGLVLPDGELFIPMRHVRTNELLGAQVVKWLPDEMRWEKKYLYGQQSKGAALRLGPRQARETCLVEGYATGLSCEAAARQMRLSLAVLVTFSAHNLTHVASITTGDRFVIADHDGNGVGEAAAKASGLRYAMPVAEGFDANDLHAKDGLMALVQLLMQARRAEVAVT